MHAAVLFHSPKALQLTPWITWGQLTIHSMSDLTHQ